MNKLFCVMEQSGLKNRPITQEHKEQFNTEYSDLYRLNWKLSDDPDADVFAPKRTWSEGRSILYEYVPKKYEYYIFIDDDIRFQAKESNTGTRVCELIADFLTKYKPISACMYSENWHNRKVKKIHDHEQKLVFPYMGQDLEVMIFQAAYAAVVMPVIYHGCGGSMWYANYLCFRAYPNKQLCYSGIHVSNLNHLDNLKTYQGYDRNDLSTLFSNDLIDHDFPSKTYKKMVVDKNLELYYEEPNPEPLTFDESTLRRHYNVNSPYFVNRAPRIEDSFCK